MGVYVGIIGANGTESQFRLRTCPLDAWWALIDSAVLKDHPDYEHDDETYSWTYPLDASELERNADAATAIARTALPDFDVGENPLAETVRIAREAEAAGQRALFYLSV